MNMEYDEVYTYIDGLNKIGTDNNIIICPSSIYLEAFVNNCNWGIGSQNFYYEMDGDYTGEISTKQLRSLGVEYSLVGHYERTKYFNETLKDTKKKLESAIDANIIPILCFGEEKDEGIEELKKKLDILLKDISHIEFIIFAYEPVYYISGKEIDDFDELENRINFIYEYLEEKYKVKPNIIYGGGINEKNIEKILKFDKLSGMILGSGSTDLAVVSNIVGHI